MNINTTGNDKKTVNCLCGCKNLQTEDMMKRHLSILAFMVFLVSLGLVALNSYQRDRLAKASNSPISAEIGPGATQAAETEFPTITPTQQIYSYQASPPQQTYEQYIPDSQARANLIRTEKPTLTVLAVSGMDGKTRIKRIVRK